MSEAHSHPSLDDVIRQLYAEHYPGTVVTGWAMVVSSTVSGDVDSTAYAYFCAPMTSKHVLMGLAEMLRLGVRGG